MQSLAVGNSEVQGQSRITTVIPGSAEATSKIIKQLNKLVNVLQVCTLAPAMQVSPVCTHSEAWLLFIHGKRENGGESLNHLCVAEQSRAYL